MCAKEQTSGIETLFGVQILTLDFLITVLISIHPLEYTKGLPEFVIYVFSFVSDLRLETKRFPAQ